MTMNVDSESESDVIITMPTALANASDYTAQNQILNFTYSYSYIEAIF